MCNEDESPEPFYDLLQDVILVLALSDYIISKTDRYKQVFEKYALDVTNYPIYNGIKILNKNRDFIQISKILKSWRNQIVYIQYEVD